MNKEFLKQLSRKLKTGNLRTIHLNALPGRYATRLDVFDLGEIDADLPHSFLNHLHADPNFRFPISFDRIRLSALKEESQNRLNFVAKKLNALYYENNDNLLEHGIKTFGFGYPLLIKRDKRDPNRIIKAPILIWNLDIDKSVRKTNEWAISRSEEYSVSINDVLISHLESDENISISKLSPELLEDGIVNENEMKDICSEVLRQLNAITENDILSSNNVKCPDRDIIENLSSDTPSIIWAGIFGLYRAQKESIIKDIDNLLKNFDSFQFDKLKVERYQTSSVSSIPTDPSQEEIINSLSHKNTKIIQGPPGTGKSQSLTAIITNALENNAKCLVVCEKKTALDVIYENLKRLEIENLCVVIDDVSKDRRKVIDAARNVIDEGSATGVGFRKFDFEQKYQRFIELRNEINRKHHAVIKKIFGDDHWKDLIGRFIANDKKQSRLLLSKSLNEDYYDYDYKEYSKLSKIVNDGSILFEKVGKLENPLIALRDSCFIGSYSHSRRVALEGNLSILENLACSVLKNLNEGFRTFGEKFFDNRKFRIKITKLLSLVLSKFKELRKQKETVMENFSKLVKAHETKSILDYEFKNCDNIDSLENIVADATKFLEQVRQLKNNLSDFKEYYDWRSFYVSLENKNKEIVNALSRTETTDWNTVFKSWYYDKVLTRLEKELGPFLTDKQQIEELGQLTNDLKASQRKKIQSIWAEKVSNSIARYQKLGGNAKALYNYRRNNQYGRQNSLRKIIETDSALFTDLFPVVLLNPVVCGSIMPMREGMFDVVIFDEASQLRIEDTYTSLIRGKHKIVSGDKHQMPPSDYFQGGAIMDYVGNESDVDEEDGNEIGQNDNIVLAESESLLKFASDSNYSTSYLDFHYRSRHPYLIDFSNAAFYGSRLIPMPAQYEYKPIRFVPVNGLYEKNGTNPAEARKIINILFEEIKPFKNGVFPSVGIATLNMYQRNLILNLIQDECLLNPKYLEKFLNINKSGFFVKNLENIQGDEKDIIIISTTFGLDSEGRFDQRFGPINQSKGYKLLNVIITRAKYRVYLCTSIPNEYISRYKAEIENYGNVKKGIFYAYLAYCKSIEQDNENARLQILSLLKRTSPETSLQKIDGFVESPFEQEVYDYLIQHIEEGRIAPQHRIGGFLIDFIVKSKINNEPLVAVECDGASYHSSNEAYAYDLYRQEQLEKYGLKVYRIWSTNWWNAREKEIQKLIAFIDAVDQRSAKDIGIQTEPVIEDESSTVNHKSILYQADHKDSIDSRKTVLSDSNVKLLDILHKESFTVSITADKRKVDYQSEEHKIIHVDSPLARAMINKKTGDRCKVDGIEVFYEIMEIS
jgi:superfamily I DNA and/or RNA helicase/very-short-patch-repair endonuclease